MISLPSPVSVHMLQHSGHCSLYLGKQVNGKGNYLLFISLKTSVLPPMCSCGVVFMQGKSTSNSSLVSQVLPSGTGERPAEPQPAAPPGAAGAAGGALLHPEGLPQRPPVAQPQRPGAHQPAARAVGEQDHRHHNHAPEKPTTRVWLCVGGRLKTAKETNPQIRFLFLLEKKKKTTESGTEGWNKNVLRQTYTFVGLGIVLILQFGLQFPSITKVFRLWNHKAYKRVETWRWLDDESKIRATAAVCFGSRPLQKEAPKLTRGCKNPLRSDCKLSPLLI